MRKYLTDFNPFNPRKSGFYIGLLSLVALVVCGGIPLNSITSLSTYLPNKAELVSAIPVILSLIMIEGLLSVDNAMAIAAIASGLPKEQQKKALRYGIIGAYLFRGLCLLLVAWIATNQWIKVFGAAYLLYLMTKNLVADEGEEAGAHGEHGVATKSLLMTIISIEVMDLSLSLDNVVAAVALDKRLWVVCTGVFIGILALRFVASYCIRLIEIFPILQKTAFLLIGFVGVILLVEIGLDYAHMPIHISSMEKFIGIISITGATLLYGHTAVGKRFLHPVVRKGMPVLKVMNTVLSWLMLPFVGIFRGLKWLFSVKKTVPVECLSKS